MTTLPNYPLTGPDTGINRIGQWLRRVLLASLALLLALAASVWLAGAWMKAKLTNQYPPPGQRIDVGGYRLHLNCAGQGSPTVVLEAGLNDFSVLWAKVQPAVSTFTRVCTYDRAGLGWSDPSPHPRTSAMMVDELYTLLTNARLDGPYLLVGHSFGGINMRLFAQRHPAEVVGLVLVDSAHEGQVTRIPALKSAVGQLVQQFGLLSLLNRSGLIALMPKQIPDRGLPADALAEYRAVLATTGYFQAASDESKAFADAGVSSSTVKPASLGDLPLIVLSRGQPAPMPGLSAAENEEYEQSWRGLQAQLAALSSNRRQIIAEQSGHDIHLQQPELVIAAIRQLVQTK